MGGGSTTLSVDDVECLINEREEAVTKLSCAELEISLLKEGKTVLHNLSEENCVLRAKLAAMEGQRFNVKEFIRRCQDQWDFDVKIASKMLEISKYVPTAPTDKSAARITEQDAREIADNVMEFNYDHKHSVDYWMREEGCYLLNKLNADREQVSAVSVPEIIEAVANFVGSQKGGPFTPAVIKAAIIGQLKYGDAFTKLSNSPVPSHSQQSAITDSDRINYLAETRTLIHKMQEGGYFLVYRNGEASYGGEDFRAIIDKHITDRCPSHESELSASPAPDSEGE